MAQSVPAYHLNNGALLFGKSVIGEEHDILGLIIDLNCKESCVRDHGLIKTIYQKHLTLEENFKSQPHLRRSLLFCMFCANEKILPLINDILSQTIPVDHRLFEILQNTAKNIPQDISLTLL